MEHNDAPLVGLVMGSDSDWKTMSAAAETLQDFGIPFETRVVSAHRMPIDMLEYASTAAERGLKVLLAGAGGAAHLPGMLASATVLPVIGVPVPLKYLDGLDSLLSIVQMPGGVPVATVGVGNAKNAALLAVRILGADQGGFGAALRQKMLAYQALLRQVAIDKGAALQASLAELSSESPSDLPSK